MRDLIERLEKATGAAPSLWPLLTRALYGDTQTQSQIERCIRALDGSIDAALALAKEVLDGKIGPITLCIAGSGQCFLEANDPCGWHIDALGATPALAILIATLKAKEAGQ